MKITCIKGRAASITSLDEGKTMIVSFKNTTLRFDRSAEVEEGSCVERN